MSNRAARRAQMKGQRKRGESALSDSLEWVAEVCFPRPERHIMAAAMLRYLTEAGPHLSRENSCFLACETIKEFLKHGDQPATVLPVTLTVADARTQRIVAAVGSSPAHMTDAGNWTGHVVLLVHGLGALDPTAGQANIIHADLPRRPMFMPRGDVQLAAGGAAVVQSGDYLYHYVRADVDTSYLDDPTVTRLLGENADMAATDGERFREQLAAIRARAARGR